MGLFGPDVFQLIDETTTQMKLKKNKEDAYRRYLNYNDLEAKRYLISIGEKPLPPSVPEVQENIRKNLEEMERLKKEQNQISQPVITTHAKPSALPTQKKTVVLQHAPRPVPQQNFAPPIIASVQPQQQTTTPATTTAYFSKLTDVIQDRSTLVEAGLAAVAGFVLGGENRIMAAILGFSVPITVKTLI